MRPDTTITGRPSPRHSAARILVVDDDSALRGAVVRALELEGYEVYSAADGFEALTFFDGAETEPDAVVLDVLMPNLDGLMTCRAIRAKSRVPILMLTARQSVEEKVEGLDAGADDYLSKPFAVVELMARVHALLRRAGHGEEILRFADLELDPAERRVHRAGEQIDLTRIEFALLHVFLSSPRTVISRAALFERVWGYEMEFASNSLEVYVGHLRRKTEAGGRSRLIHTERGIGYVLRDQP